MPLARSPAGQSSKTPINTIANNFRDPLVVQRYIRENRGAELIQSYIIYNEELALDTFCTTCEKVVGTSSETTTINSEKFDGAKYLIFCISCDRLYHLSCLRIDVLENSNTPWLCPECREFPENDAAVAFMQSRRFPHSLELRLAAIKPPLSESISESEKEDEDTTFFATSLNVNMEDGRPNLGEVRARFLQQQEETRKLGEQLLEARKAAEELQAVLEKKKREEREAKVQTKREPQHKQSEQAHSSKAHGHFRSQKDQKSTRIPGMIYADDFNIRNSTRDSTFTSRANPHAQSDPSQFNPSTEAAMLALEKISLNQLRNVLPIVKEFNGDPAKWLTFERSINLLRTEGAYSDAFMKHLVRDKLTGFAATYADKLFDTHTFDGIMERLKNAFGNPQIVVEDARKRVNEIRLKGTLTQAAVLEASTTISAYLHACKQAKIQSHDRTLAQNIHKQLDPRYAEGYFLYFKINNPGRTIEPDLEVLLDYFDHIRDTLALGTFTTIDNSNSSNKKDKSFQLSTISASTNPGHSNASHSQSRNLTRSSNRRRSDNYVIRDINTAAYQGYYLDRVKAIPAHCVICNKNGHYTVECKAYKRKSLEERQKFVESKGLCQNCVLTSEHKAKNCNIKKQCGAQSNGTRCELKHHISLHSRSTAKQFNVNSASKQDKSPQPGTSTYSESSNNSNYSGFPITDAKGSNQPIFKINKDGFQVLTLSKPAAPAVESSPRTIKLFRTYVTHDNQRAATYTVGDSAAEISIVKRSLVDALGITGPPCTIGIQWTDDSCKNISGIKVNLPIRGILPNCQEFIATDCYAIEDFNLPPRSLNVEKLKKEHHHLRSIPFDSYQNVSPAILLGSKHAALVEAIAPIWEDGEGKPIGVLTKLGYTIYGGESNNNSQADVLNAISAEISQNYSEDENLVTNEDLNKQYELSISLDSFHLKPIGCHYTLDEKSALFQAENGFKHLSSGFVQMPLIWRMMNNQKPKLPDNFAMVLRRQLAQENKLKRNPEYLEAFNNNFKSLIDEGYVRAATKADMHTPHNVNYVPMSLVVNTNKRPIKTRNVYDASAKYKGTSLNANLLSGPNLLIDLLKPLMQMRENAVAFTGDIKSMFHRIRIDPADQNCQRILWRPNTDEPMQIYIQQAMLFGPSCSPFCSQYAKNWAAKQFSEIYPETAESIQRDSYMDDWFTSVPSIELAIQRIQEGIKIFDFINMQLLGIQSNEPSVLSALPEAHIKKDLIPLLSGNKIQCVSKVLGVSWDISSDKIIFEINEDLLIDKFQTMGIKPTKREQCSTIARIFDVLGLLSHCVIRARILLQRSWKKQIDWDQEIDNEEAELWSQWLKDIKKAATVKIPRVRSSLDCFMNADKIELHTFCDAGQEALAAVAYFVAIHSNTRQSSFVMAKTKVAPLKSKSKQVIHEMPRLEVLGALTAARLASHIKQLHSHLSFRQYFWCDSEVVLRWLWNTNLKLPKFAISPIGEILETTEIHQWKYVESKLNVADLGTKFQPLEFGDSNSIWFTGPEFIRCEPSQWPSQRFSEEKLQQAILCTVQLSSDNDDQSSSTIENPLDCCPPVLPPYDCPLTSITNRETGVIEHSAIMTLLITRKPSIYFNWSKLVRATARMLIMRNKVIIPTLKARSRSRSVRHRIAQDAFPENIIDPEYIHMAELFLIRYMQHQKWGKEIEKLSKNHRTNDKELISLNVFLDRDRIVRIRSRIDLPFREYPQKYAPLIPRFKEKDNLTEIMLFYYHYMYRHVCIESQMAEFRSKYWMTALRTKLRSVRYRCNLCKLRKALDKPPLMANLPNFRIDRKLKPFEVTGLDCCGPFSVTVRKTIRKVWILLFTCTVTRFISLEVLENIDSKSTLAAIASVYTAHGPITRLLSDNGTNFVGVSNLLHREQARLIKELQKCQNDVNNHYLKQLQEFRWEFIPVKAAWFGGFYERLVGEVKRGMEEEIHDKNIDIFSFKIAMHETAHRLNCRPLTHLPVSHHDEELLTPHHLAKNRSGWPLLPSAHTFQDTGRPIDEREYYVNAQKLADKITRRFYKNYLSELTQRAKWTRNQPGVNIGDLVLIIDPNVTRRQWQRGIIETLLPSRDGIHRVAEIRVSDGTLKKRAIQHIVKIDVATI